MGSHQCHLARFVDGPRHIWLGHAINGFNPFGEKSSSWSTWPIMFLNYNQPPWLVTKKVFRDSIIDNLKPRERESGQF